MPRRRVGASKHLNRIPTNSGATSAAKASATAAAAWTASASSALAAIAVAVLEVQPQVLDRIGLQLGGDSLRHLRGQR